MEALVWLQISIPVPSPTADFRLTYRRDICFKSAQGIISYPTRSSWWDRYQCCPVLMVPMNMIFACCVDVFPTWKHAEWFIWYTMVAELARVCVVRILEVVCFEGLGLSYRDTRMSRNGIGMLIFTTVREKQWNDEEHFLWLVQGTSFDTVLSNVAFICAAAVTTTFLRIVKCGMSYLLRKLRPSKTVPRLLLPLKHDARGSVWTRWQLLQEMWILSPSHSWHSIPLVISLQKILVAKWCSSGPGVPYKRSWLHCHQSRGPGQLWGHSYVAYKDVRTSWRRDLVQFMSGPPLGAWTLRRLQTMHFV